MKSPAEGSAAGKGQLAKIRATWNGLMKGTIYSSIFTLLTTCIGAGTLSLPYAFDQVRTAGDCCVALKQPSLCSRFFSRVA